MSSGVAARDDLIGRSGEMSRAAAAIQDGRRVVTVLGAAGAGKSRLAREVAAAHSDALLVDVSAARSMGDLASALGASLDVAFVATDSGELSKEIGRVLAGRAGSLVVLDGFDALVALAGETVGAWSRAAPSTQFLVTAREPLRIEDEVRIEVAPLPIGEACELFRRRLAAVRAPGAVDDEARIRRIVERLDGLPLAIELAASRGSLLSLEELERRLEHRLELLRSDRRDGKPDHVTLRAALESSWESLSAHERAVLARCAVFESSFTVAAAERVVASASPHGTLDALQSLRERSLIVSVPPVAGETRLRVLEVVRDLAAEHLDASEAAAEVRARHAADAVERAELLASRLDKPDGSKAADQLVLEERDLVAAARWLDRARPEQAARLYLALAAVALLRLPIATQLERAEHALASAERARSAALATRALVELGRVHLRRGSLDDAERALGRAREDAMAAGDSTNLALAATYLATVLLYRGKRDEAAALAREALAIFEREGRAADAAGAWVTIGGTAYYAGDEDAARAAWERAVDLGRSSDSGRDEPRALGNLAILYADRGRYEAARELHEAALDIHRTLRDRRSEASELHHLGWLAHVEGRLEQATACFSASVALSNEVDFRRNAASCTSSLALLELEAGRRAEARRLVSDAVRAWREIGHTFIHGGALVIRGLVDALDDRAEDARDSLDDARARLEAATTGWGRAIDVLAAAVDLAEARRSGDDARRLEAAARAAELARRARDAGRSREERLVGRILAGLLSPAAAETESAGGVIELDAEARLVRVNSDLDIDLSRRGAPRRILLALARAHEQRERPHLDVDRLFRAGWPGEMVRPQSRTNRVYVAVATLRDLGLRHAIVSERQGYRLSPGVEIRWRA